MIPKTSKVTFDESMIKMLLNSIETSKNFNIRSRKNQENILISYQK